MVSPTQRTRIRTALAIFITLLGLIPAGAAQALDLATVQEAIRLSGARWVAAETSVSGLSDAEKRKLVGLLPEPEPAPSEAAARTLFQAPITPPLPVRLDWSDFNGGSYVTPARHQGICGSCWSFAGIGALESYTMLRTLQPGLAIDLSEQAILSCHTSGGCNGGSGQTIAELMRDVGAVTEDCLSYAMDDDAQLCNGRCDDWRFETRTIIGFRRVLGYTASTPREEIVTTLKTHLAAYGPLWTSMQVYEDFYNYTGQIYTYTSGAYMGGHAVLLIGYDDDRETFKVKNSWGTGWGTEGRFEIAYSQVANDIRFGAYTYVYGDPVDLEKALPTADAGDDAAYTENEAVTLDGTGSHGPDGAVDRYHWHQLAGPAVDLDDAHAASPSFAAPDIAPADQAELIFRLTVMQNGLIAEDSVTITVAGVNQLPTARAGDERAVAEGEAVDLDGGLSTDPDGEALGYHWQQIGGPSVTLSRATTARPSFTAPNLTAEADTALRFRLTVTDPQGAQDSDTVAITVRWVNDAPEARIAAVAAADEGATVELDGSASSDREGRPLNYLWTQIDGPDVHLTAADTARPRFTAPNLQTAADAALTFELTVSDPHGATDSDRAQVTVRWENDPPTASAGGDRTVAERNEVVLDGSASRDREDAIDSYRWRQSDGPPVSLQGADSVRPSFTAPNLTEAADAALSFILTVGDKAGASATDRVTVTVTWENDAPEADAGEDQTVAAGDPVQLDAGVSSDRDDGIAAYRWTQMAGPEVVLSSPTAAQTAFTAPLNEGADALLLSFELQVTDHGGLSASDRIDIRIPPRSAPPDPDPDPGPDVDPPTTASGGGGGGCFVISLADG